MPPPGIRIACVYVPDFAVEVALRSLSYEPEGGLAILAESDFGPLVVAASRGARLDGVRPGMTSAAALAVAPEVLMLEQGSLSLGAAQVEVERAVRVLCPSLCSSGDGIVYLNFAGMERRYAARGELGFLDDLQLAVTALQLPVRMGMADTRFAARAAAVLQPKNDLQQIVGRAGEPHRVRHGMSREFLAPLPISLLPQSAAEKRLLQRLGIRNLGQLAELHSSSLRRRLGTRGLELQALARGREISAWRRSDDEARFCGNCDSEFPTSASQGLRALFQQALAQVLEALDSSGLAPSRMSWFLSMGADSRQGSVAAPSRSCSEQLWLRLLSRAVDQVELSGPVNSVKLEALEVGPPSNRQKQLPGPRVVASEAVTNTLDKLRSELGGRGFGKAVLHASLQPEARQSITPYVSNQSTSQRKALSAGSGYQPGLELADGALPGQLPQAFRAVQPPEPIVVELRKGRPYLLRWSDASVVIERSLGPWDISSQWWGNQPLRRRYFQLQAPGILAQVYRTAAQGEWFLSGWWD